MAALLGCDHCGTVIRRVLADGDRECPGCRHPMRAVGLLEARELARERRTADRYRMVARIESRKGADYRPGVI
jgi:uncharacterized Zn finger protein (UPF0148 family)